MVCNQTVGIWQGVISLEADASTNWAQHSCFQKDDGRNSGWGSGRGRKGAGEGKGMGDGYALQPRKRVMRGRRRLSGLGDVEQ